MLLLKNAKILTMTGKDLDCGDILIENGKISKIGTSIKTTKKIEIQDFKNCTIIPGLFDAHSHCGLHELDHGGEGNDTNEASSYNNARVRSIDGFSYYDTALRDAANGGVTSICIAPGSLNILNGQMSVVKTTGTIVDQHIVHPFCGMKAALGENAKINCSSAKRPTTRMGIAAQLREELYNAQNYLLEKKEKKKEKKPFKLNLTFEALVPVLERKIPLRTHAHRADDICTAIRIAEEFKLKLVIEHGTSAHLIADYLISKKIPLVLGPFLSTRKKSELVDRTFETAGILSKKGGLVAITVDHPVIPIDSLLVNAILAHRHGMGYYEALQSITINPAKICLCDHQIGSIEVGKDADLLVLNGDPLDARTKPVAVYQDGKQVNQ